MSRAERNKKKRWIRLYTVFLVVASLAIMLAPYAVEKDNDSQVPMMIVGVLFWVGLLGAVAVNLRIGMARRKDPTFSKRGSRLKYLGLTHFFKNGNALLADVGMILSLIVFIVLEQCDANQKIVFLFLGLLIFTFGMHCMLNGLNYLYINQKRKKEGTSYEK